MSNHLFNQVRPRADDTFTKNLTPKSTKYSPKVSPLFSSVRNGGVIKQDISKGKITKPSTSKNVNESAQYFHSKDNPDKKHPYTSTRKLDLTAKAPLSRPVYQYQPRSKSKSPIRQQEEITRDQINISPKTFTLGDRGIQITENKHPPLPKILLPISNFQAAKFSNKQNGNIKAFAASTNQGPVRDYNEDRVAIILTIPRPKTCINWKKTAYFGVFDGHGGMACAEFLRDNLHLFIAREKNFPSNMNQAIWSGFQKCEKAFMEKSYSGELDRSGSCGIISFFYDDECYISNVGDSRAIMSTRGGQIIQELSLDHKASDQFEQKRIIDNNGKIYQTRLRSAKPGEKIFYEGEEHDFVMGPHRAYPGRLSVTRTFGDIDAKLPEFGGNQKAIVCLPQIRSIKVTPECDFIILGCDGIYDKLQNSEVIDIVWDTFRRDRGSFTTLHQFCGKAVENIMKLSFHKKTADNVTVVMIALQGLENYFNASERDREPTEIVLKDKKPKIASKLENSFEQRQGGRSVSPINYSSLRTKSFYTRQ